MERTNRMLLYVAVLLALLVGLGVYTFYNGLETMATVEYTDEVVVAKTNIPARTTISSDMLEIQNIPKGTRHVQATASTADVVGKITTQAIIAGEPVLTGRIFSSTQQSGIAYQLPIGYRALSIGINQRIAVAYLLRPGDFVDVVVSYEPVGADEPQSAIMLQRIEVLAIGAETRVGATAPAGAETITLAVRPDQVERLVWAEDNGRLRLALRPVTDTQTSPTTGANSRTVIGPR